MNNCTFFYIGTFDFIYFILIIVNNGIYGVLNSFELQKKFKVDSFNLFNSFQQEKRETGFY